MNTTKVGAGPLSLAAVAALALGTIALAPSADAATGPSAYRSHAPSASVANGTLTILGSRHDDHVTLALSADSSHLLVDLGDGSGVRSIDRATFTNVAAFLGAGDDTFTATGVPIPMTVHGGSGDDTITGGAADDELFGGRGNDAILGGDGNDVIFGGRGDDVVDGQRGTDTEFLGRGDDRAAWFPGEGNDNVDGGSGVDTLAFDGSNGNEKFAVSASGPHAVLTRDLGNIRMDTADVEVLDLAALGGTDVVKVGDLSGTALRETDVDLGGT
ncbi:MAG TPA: calcium-binding protein, partial [Candidatus Limnocylindrales bacterium]|nr:calcium-binding protein [Candidatus Limnocylindrales bacterium]